MPSRRRSRSKNLNNNLSDVQRRLRSLERRPVRTKLASRVVTKAAIAPNSVSEDEVSFGTAVVVPPGEDINDVVEQIENPKEGLLVVDTDTGESQVYSEQTETFVTIADPIAQDEAALAAANALAAQQTADGKNKVFRQNDEPISTQGPFTVGDIWFDTNDNNKIYRYAGTPPTWGAVQLGGSALANINANSITAGTIDASVITVSNINAGNISAGNIASARLTTTELNATNITSGSLSASRIGAGTITAAISISGPTIIGGTFKTSLGNSAETYNRVEITDSDEIKFYNESNTVVGRLGPFDYGVFNSGIVLTGGSDYYSSPYINLQSANGAASIYMGIAGSYPSINMYNGQTSNPDDTGGMLIATGGATSAGGLFRVSAGQEGIRLEAWTDGGGGPNFIEFREPGQLDLLAGQINMFGPIVVYGETVGQGSGTPSFTGVSGQLYFNYT